MPRRTDEQRRRLARALRPWIAGYGGPAQAARALGMDYGTVKDAIDGIRWPQPPTLRKFEKAMGKPAGWLDEVGLGTVVSPEAETPPEGLSTDDLLAELRRRLGPGSNLKSFQSKSG